MAKIKLLDQQTASKIAAGEVIINPASVIKELTENSIDAKSSVITVEIKDGGKDLISIKDNGVGMSAEDVLLAFKRHATSKINSLEDLEKTYTLGFRGEALASIAAISKIDLKTKEKSSNTGSYIKIHGGKVIGNEEIGCAAGTIINVSNIFYNTPARYKYLKKDSIESGYISSILERIALSHPEISIKFINDGRKVFHTPGNNDLYSCIYSLYGKDFANNLIKIDYVNHPMKITGYIGKPELSRTKKKYQIFFINQRYVKNKILSQALEEAYKGLIMIHKFPVAILNINLPPDMLDVNVHPAKTEILFRNESLIYLLIKQAIREQLRKISLIPEIKINDRFERQRPEANLQDTQEKISFKNLYENDIKNTSNKLIKEEFRDKSIGINESVQNTRGYNNNQKELFNEGNDTSRVYRNNDMPSLGKDEKVSNKSDKELLETLKEGRIIGQIFSTYIIVEIPRGLLLIDQHAAHERISFNRLKKQYKENNVISQKLLIPIDFDVSFQEHQLINEFLPVLKKLGFDIELSRENNIVLNSVPVIMGIPQNKNYFLNIMDHLQELRGIRLTYEKEEKLISLACKSSVKANDVLQTEEINQLVSDLINTDKPYTCPHGRPTIIKITQYELEKLFKRIQ